MNANKLSVSFIGKLMSDVIMGTLPKGSPVADFYVQAESPRGKNFSIQACVLGQKALRYRGLAKGTIVHIKGYVSEPKLIGRKEEPVPTYNISVTELEVL